MTKKTPKKKPKQRRTYSARHFKRQVSIFVAITLVVLIAIVYFAFAKTVITVTPKVQEQTLSLTLTVGPKPTDTTTAAPDLIGTVVTKDVSSTVTQTTTANPTEEPAQATGTVTLYNKYSRTQPLQAGTRLMADGNILFRTTERVDVPVGGTVDVNVIADQPGKQGEIQPSHFVIVALWPGLQSQIYGESTKAFTGGTKQTVSVTEDDLIAAQKLASAQLEKDGKAALTTDLAQDQATATYAVLATTPSTIVEKPGAVVGDTVPSFSYTDTTAITAVAGLQSDLQTFLQKKVAGQVGEGYRFINTLSDPSVTVKDADAEHHTATLQIRIKIQAVLQSANPIFSTDHLVNTSRSDVRTYFAQFPDIEKVEIHFSPFWLFRAPALPDHIQVKVLDPVQTK